MNISQILEQAQNRLKTAKVEPPALDAMILMEKAMAKDRTYLIAHGDEKIPAPVLAAFDNLLARRLKREPISQITGKKEFFGREFMITKDVLTPRPETELVIEAALKKFKKTAEINILDLGTGSGCIILTLLAELPKAKGTGVDSSKTALAIARENAYNLKIQNVEFIDSDWCKNLESQQQFQLIVSNPPYVAKRERRNLQAELSYEPKAALFSGNDGLESYRQIAKEISGLKFDFAIFEIGSGQESKIRKIFEKYQMRLEETLKDLAGIPRVMVFKK